MESYLISTKDLSKEDTEDMYLLLSTHFQGVKRNIFDGDLANKNWVILFKDEKVEKLQGFSTLLIYKTKFEGESLNVFTPGILL
jgi:hypothetical protein